MQAQRHLDLEGGQVSSVPQENAALETLGLVNQDGVRELGDALPQTFEAP